MAELTPVEQDDKDDDKKDNILGFSETYWKETIALEREENRKLQKQLKEKDETNEYYKNQLQFITSELQNLKKRLDWIFYNQEVQVEDIVPHQGPVKEDEMLMVHLNKRLTQLEKLVKESKERANAMELNSRQYFLDTKRTIENLRVEAIATEEKWLSIMNNLRDCVKPLTATTHFISTHHCTGILKNDLAILCQDIIKHFDNCVADICLKVSIFVNNRMKETMMHADHQLVESIKTNLQLILNIGEGIVRSEPYQITEKLTSVQFNHNSPLNQSIINTVNDLKTRSGCPLLTFALMISSLKGRNISFTDAAELLADFITDRFPDENLPSTKDAIIKHFVTPEDLDEDSCMAPLVKTGMITLQGTIQGENAANLPLLNENLKRVAFSDDLFKRCRLIMLTLSYRYRSRTGHVVAASRVGSGDSMALHPIDAQTEDFRCSPLVFVDVCKVDVYSWTLEI